MSIRNATPVSLVCSMLLLTAPVSAQPVGFDDLNASSARMAGCPAATPDVADSRFDLYYELKVRFHNHVQGNVDVVWAGGKLLMNGQPDGKGALAMSLVQPLEAPWKFYTRAQNGYHNVYYLSERTLPSGTWPARDASVIDNRELGKERCEKWAKEWGGKHVDLQTLPFWVIGDPSGRFGVVAGPDGALGRVTNRMTHRWLPAGFENWVAGKPEEGYGFWRADREPPDFAPHCYDGFAAALAMLGQSGFPGGSPEAAAKLGENGTYEVTLANTAEKLRQLVETLMPQCVGQFSGNADAVVKLSVVESTGAALTVAGTADSQRIRDGHGARFSIARNLSYQLDRRQMVSDALSLHLVDDKETELWLDVGYRPHR